MRRSLFILIFLTIWSARSASSQAADHGTGPDKSTPLNQLLTEAANNNSQIHAAEDAWKAAQSVAAQVSTLPDPHLNVQSFSVGDPLPGAGLNTSNFAYMGIGASQQIPFPGKLKLRGAVARLDANTSKAEAESLRTEIAAQVKAIYFQLAYLQATLEILNSEQVTLRQLSEDALAHYRVGSGTQGDVLRAQLEQTKILTLLTISREQSGQLESELKYLLHRPQVSADIVAAKLAPTPVPFSIEQLLATIPGQNPQIHVDDSAISRQSSALELAHRNGKPDFDLGYEYERTGLQYPAYYMATFTVEVPRRRRFHAELEEAKEKLIESQHKRDSDLQQKLASLKAQYVTATSTEELIQQYQQGLLPQSEAAFRSDLVGYESDRQQFHVVLRSFLALQQTQLAYEQVLDQHQAAIAQIEQLTGVRLQ